MTSDAVKPIVTDAIVIKAARAVEDAEFSDLHDMTPLQQQIRAALEAVKMDIWEQGYAQGWADFAGNMEIQREGKEQ